MLAEQGGLAFLQPYLQGRFLTPFSELTGCRIEAIDEQQGAVTMAMTMPTTEWLCRFSRCVAPGAIASLANSCSLASGWLLVQPAQSFAGLAHSTSFFRAVPADGRLLRAEARGTIRGRGLANVDIDVYNADGQLAASAHASVQLIDSSHNALRCRDRAVRRHRGRHGWRRVLLCPLRFPGARATVPGRRERP